VSDERDPKLDGFDALVGQWETEGSHPFVKEPISGHASFEWLPGRRFLIWRSEQTPTTVPTAIAIIGGGDTPGTWPLHYFDSRGVFRVYTTNMAGGVWRFWRDEPGFLQRATGTFRDGGRVLEIRTELNEHGTWKPDLEMTYRRRSR
jgi:hypothetical protein